MCEWGAVVVVETPDWLWDSRAVPQAGIAIDSCIAPLITNAWAEGVRTLGSCCGHGTTAPNVVLTQDVEQPELARRVLSGWTLHQWQLVDVSTVSLPDTPPVDWAAVEQLTQRPRDQR